MSNPETTHYVAAFTTRFRGRDRAVCGAYLDPHEFSTQPTCPLCKDWLAEDEAGFNSIKDLGPAEHPVTAPHFDIFEGYTERKR